MLLVKTKNELKSHLSNLKKNELLGLVPTMGALHKGHATLIEKAVEQNDTVVVSIFVNPTQFNNKKDLENYPQTLDADIKILKNISNDIIVFAPSVEDVYDKEVSAKLYDFQGLDKVMEGAFRDNHFNGVATIVEQLLRLVAPDNAYFGEKDYQQLQIIKKLTLALNLSVSIIGCPIVREPSGLAMSSRNERLSPEARKDASFIYQTLLTAKELFGMKNVKDTKKWVANKFNDHPLFKVEYFEITDAETLIPVQKKQEHRKYRAFVAVYAEGVRLIDNISLN